MRSPLSRTATLVCTLLGFASAWAVFYSMRAVPAFFDVELDWPFPLALSAIAFLLVCGASAHLVQHRGRRH